MRMRSYLTKIDWFEQKNLIDEPGRFRIAPRTHPRMNVRCQMNMQYQM
jgi:hypothetical protein